MNIHTLILKEIALPITPRPSILATRLVGRRFWDRLRASFQSMGIDAVVFLDFTGIEVMDASFADAVFGTLAVHRARKLDPLCLVILEAANETCVENIQMALQTRIDREPADLPRLRNCVLPLFDGTDVTLIGKYEDHVLQTFELLAQRHRLTAREMADSLGINLTAASTRLKTLADLGLARRFDLRNALGREFVYKTLR